MEKIKRPVLYHTDTRPDKENFTRAQICDNTPMGTVVWIGGWKDDFTAFVKDYHLCVMGPRIFWKKNIVATMTFKNGKIYGNISLLIKPICQAFKLDWITTNPWTLRLLESRKDLWQMVLRGKVTNPEDLAKAFSRKYFQKAYSYRSLKEYFSIHSGMSLWDIYYYTTNPNEALALIAKRDPRVSIMHDMLRYCRINNTKINPLWSYNRMQAEHQKQIEEKELARLEQFSDIPIVKPGFSKEGLSLILDERSCYLEGVTMHNCVHSCYWGRIKRGGYLIARGVVNEEKVDVGILYNNYGDYLEVEQVHTIYNGEPLPITTRACKEWTKRYEKELLEIVKTIRSSKPLSTSEEEEYPF